MSFFNEYHDNKKLFDFVRMIRARVAPADCQKFDVIGGHSYQLKRYYTTASGANVVIDIILDMDTGRDEYAEITTYTDKVYLGSSRSGAEYAFFGGKSKQIFF